MADWQRKLKLNPEWDEANDDETKVAALAQVIAQRLKALEPFNDEGIDGERDEIVDEFNDLSSNQDATFEDLNSIMNRLWDWGDTPLDNKFGGKKVCFIDTMSKG